MPVYNGGGFLLSGTAGGSGARGSTLDNRVGDTQGYLYYSAAGASAILTVQVAHDATAWMPLLTITATTGIVGATATISAFYPYYAAQINALYSGAAGTASPVVHFTPGVG